MGYLKKYFHLQILAAVIFFAAYPAFTQNSVILPRVGVAPIGMSDKENIQLNIISERVRDSAVLVLRYLDNYELGRNALPEPSAYDNETLLQYCERENLDSLVYGKTYKRGDDSFIIEMSVFNRESGKTTVTRMEKAETALEIFEAADNATYSLIKGFSGRRIAFGRIAVKLTGEKGVYVPYLDGEEYPADTGTFDRVLTGKRRLEIFQERMLGNIKIFDSILEVSEGETALAEIEIPYLLSEEEDLINEQAEIIERFSDRSIEKPKERKKVAEAYSRIDNLLVRTDYNEGLTLLKEQYRQERKTWELLLAEADAQPAGKREFVVGARGGASIGFLKELDDENTDEIVFSGDGSHNISDFNDQLNFAPLWGLFTEVQLLNNLYLQFEYNRKKIIFYEDDATGTSHQLVYNEFPLLFKYKIRTKAGRFGILAGPALKTYSSGGGVADFNADEYDPLISYGDTFQDTANLFLTAGLEYSLNIGRHKIYADIRRSWLELFGMSNQDFVSTVDVIALEFSAGYGYNFGGTGEISRKRVEDNKEKKANKWLFPAGIGVLNQEVGGEGKPDTLTLFGVLYRFTDTFYAGITPGISFGGDFGAFISLAWTDDPDLFINSFSFFAIPASEFVMFGAFYNMAYRRFYIGPMVWVNSNLDRFSSGLFAGYYF